MNSNSEINNFIGVVFGIGCGAAVTWLALKRKSCGYPQMLFLKKDPYLIKEPSLPTNKDVKLVVIVRKDLKMTKGKGISQSCHATVKAVKRTLEKFPEVYTSYVENGRAKAVLKVNDRAEMEKIALHAKQMGLLVSPVIDAGRTQIAPGELTAIGLGPGPADLLDEITGGLPPY